MQTLYDVEKKKIERLRKETQFHSLIGRTDIPVPKNLSGRIIQCEGINNQELLQRFQYIKLPNDSWIKKWELDGRKYRFHAYLLKENKVAIHTDLIKKHRSHISSSFMLKAEIKKFREVMVKTVKVKEKTKLSDEEYKLAMSKLKQINNPQVIHSNGLLRLAKEWYTRVVNLSQKIYGTKTNV